MSDGSRATSSRVVLAGFFALIAVAIGGFALLYFKLLGYERVALRHVPANAWFAARVDLKQVVLFAPVREHVVPVLARAMTRESDEATSLKRIEEATGVNLGMDVFELAVARTDRGQGVIIGGRLPRDGVVAGLAELLGGTAGFGCRLDGERLSCAAPRLFVEQAADGALIAATDPVLLDEMLPASDAHAALGLDDEPAGSFVLLANRFAPLGAPGLWAALGLADLSQLERLEGRVELADAVLLHVEAVPQPSASLADWPQKLESMRAAAGALLALGGGSDHAGERAIYSRLKFGARGNRATADATWERHEIEQAGKTLGGLLGRWLHENQ